jgi:hypothetical protein
MGPEAIDGLHEDAIDDVPGPGIDEEGHLGGLWAVDIPHPDEHGDVGGVAVVGDAVAAGAHELGVRHGEGVEEAAGGGLDFEVVRGRLAEPELGALGELGVAAARGGGGVVDGEVGVRVVRPFEGQRRVAGRRAVTRCPVFLWVVVGS